MTSCSGSSSSRTGWTTASQQSSGSLGSTSLRSANPTPSPIQGFIPSPHPPLLPPFLDPPSLPPPSLFPLHPPSLPPPSPNHRPSSQVQCRTMPESTPFPSTNSYLNLKSLPRMTVTSHQKMVSLSRGCFWTGHAGTGKGRGRLVQLIT